MKILQVEKQKNIILWGKNKVDLNSRKHIYKWELLSITFFAKKAFSTKSKPY